MPSTGLQLAGQKDSAFNDFTIFSYINYIWKIMVGLQVKNGLDNW